MSADRGPNRTAFTLIEIMIVMAIMAIIATVALPAFNNTAVLQSAAFIVQQDLNYAQVDSIAHRDNPRVVVFNQPASNYYLAAVSAPATPLVHPTTGAEYKTHFGIDRMAHLKGVTISALVVGGDNQLRFGRYGEIDQDTAASITLSYHGKSIKITVDPDTGRATIGTMS